MPVSEIWAISRTEELCDTDLHNPTRLPKRETYNYSWWFNRSKVESYGKKFVEILSERWNLGSCNEGILVLVVKNGPLAVSDIVLDDRAYRNSRFNFS